MMSDDLEDLKRFAKNPKVQKAATLVMVFLIGFTIGIYYVAWSSNTVHLEGLYRENRLVASGDIEDLPDNVWVEFEAWIISMQYNTNPIIFSENMVI